MRCLAALGMTALLFPITAFAQTRPAASSGFQITRITSSLIAPPQFTYSGAEQYQTNQRERWLQVEVEFAATAEVTDDVTFKYYILYNGRLLTGEVTHTNVLAGRDNRSVMYVSPHTLTRFAGNRPVTPTAVQNVAVQIVQQGAISDESSMVRTAQPQWFAALSALTGFVLNKNETPFAPLYWNRYEQIKSSR
ncbi:MAG: hypothetical protein M3Z64_01340 [Verrucomicrobiota bacterium]|nr:hypothetical protein [Verrucomicrobiota bacterium]